MRKEEQWFSIVRSVCLFCLTFYPIPHIHAFHTNYGFPHVCIIPRCFHSSWCFLCLKCTYPSNPFGKLLVDHWPLWTTRTLLPRVFTVLSHIVLVPAQKMGVALLYISRVSLEVSANTWVWNEKENTQIRKVTFVLHPFYITQSIPAELWR